MLTKHRCLCLLFFFFFKRKPAYEMLISDWSSDVCSSDLRSAPELARGELGQPGELVCDGRCGDGQGVAVGVGHPGELLQHDEARCADGDVGLAVAPRATRGVGDQDADVDTKLGRASCRETVCNALSISVGAVS